MSSQRRIVVGFDGSAGAWTAARYAAAEAVAWGGRLRVVHALLDRAAYVVTALPDLVAEAPVEARRLLDAVSEELQRDSPGVEVQTVIVERAPGSALVRASRSADLLVLGRHGHGHVPVGAEFHRVHVGAVAAHVVAYAACPVVVVGPEAGGAGGSPVVLGLDATAPSAPVISYAFEAAQRHGTSLRVCYVRTSLGGDRPGGVDDPRDDAESRLLLSEILAAWRTAFADVPVALDVQHGLDPAARLLDAAAAASLIVVGAGEPAGPPGAGPGAVPGTLVRNAACPVAVVHPQRQQDRRRQPVIG